MQQIGKISKFNSVKKDTQKPNKYLHSSSHLLADELSKKFNEPKKYGFYLKMAVSYNHDFLRKLASEVLEGKNVQTPGKLFAYLIKKNNQNKKLN